jgi:hypothetical protein
LGDGKLGHETPVLGFRDEGRELGFAPVCFFRLLGERRSAEAPVSSGAASEARSSGPVPLWLVPLPGNFILPGGAVLREPQTP